MSKLVKLAVASWRRQKLRTAMTVGSLALSVGAVVFAAIELAKRYGRRAEAPVVRSRAMEAL